MGLFEINVPEMTEQDEEKLTCLKAAFGDFIPIRIDRIPTGSLFAFTFGERETVRLEVPAIDLEQVKILDGLCSEGSLYAIFYPRDGDNPPQLIVT